MAVLAAVEDEKAPAGGGGALVGEGDLASRQPLGLEQPVTVDPDREALQLRRDRPIGGADVTGDEDRDRRGPVARQLEGLNLTEHRDTQVAVLYYRCRTNSGTDKTEHQRACPDLFGTC